MRSGRLAKRRLGAGGYACAAFLLAALLLRRLRIRCNVLHLMEARLEFISPAVGCIIALAQGEQIQWGLGTKRERKYKTKILLYMLAYLFLVL